MKTRNIILFLFLMIFVSPVFAQKGTLRGKIIDEENGETLIGAAVKIVETTTGTITDFDGNYSIELEPGTYAVEYSFISYETKKITDVEIKPGEVTIVNVNLGQAELQIEEVVVSAQAEKSTETAVMVMQRKSGKILDGISAQQISRLGDSNAAAALKRVTGISVQGGKYVYVRGLSDRYTKTLLNNAEIPALDPKKNTVQMDIFPSNIIENIVVNKTFTPDMPGESTGGLVDIATTDFPEKFTLQFSTSWEYNTQATFNDEFISYENGKYDWIGMDGGQRDIPDVAREMIDNMDEKGPYVDIIGETFYSPEELETFSQSFNKNVYPVEENAFFNHSHKFSIGNQTKLFGKALGYNVSLSYSSKFNYYNNGDVNVYSDSVPSANKKLSDRLGANDIKATGLVNLNYKLSNNHKIGIRALRNQSGSQVARYSYGEFNYESGEFVQERSLSYLDRNFTLGQLHGKHVFSKLNNATISWLSSFTYMTQDEPDTRFFNNLYNIDCEGNYDYYFKTNVAPLRLYRDMGETNIDNKIDFVLPFQMFSNNSKLKIGGAHLTKMREAKQNQMTLKNYDQFGNAYIGNHQLDGNLDQFLTEYIPAPQDGRTGVYYISDKFNDESNSYTADQTVLSGYAMLDFLPVDKLRIVTGLRLEYSDIFVENLTKNKKGGNEQLDFLPALNFTYTLIENMNLRLAMSQTIARPVFREISPQSFYDYKLGQRFTGDPDLKITKISNLDFRWEYFYDRGEMIALSGFYKSFENPIETRLDPSTQNFELLYFNSDRAEVYGIEGELRMKLDFMPFLQHFSLGGNFTLVKSVVDLSEAEMQYRDAETRTMTGQAPYVVNAYLGYDNIELGLNANLGFNVAGRKLIVMTKQATPYIYEEPRPSLNFNIGKSLGQYLNVEFSVENILDSDYEAVYDYDDPIYRLRYSEGITYGLSLKYLIK